MKDATLEGTLIQPTLRRPNVAPVSASDQAIDALVDGVANAEAERMSQARGVYLKMVADVHTGKTVAPEKISKILADAKVSADKFKADLRNLVNRDQLKVRLKADTALAATETESYLALEDLRAKRREAERDWNIRMQAAIAAHVDATEARNRVPVLTRELRALSTNPELERRDKELRDESGANQKLVEALNQELKSGESRAAELSSFLAHKAYRTPEQRAEWELIVNGWPQAKKQLADLIGRLEERQAEIPDELEALDPEFVASVL